MGIEYSRSNVNGASFTSADYRNSTWVSKLQLQTCRTPVIGLIENSTSVVITLEFLLVVSDTKLDREKL